MTIYVILYNNIYRKDTDMKENALDQHFDNWQELLEELRINYTLSYRDVCKILKASRTWVNAYIRPHIKTIYINSNKRGEYQIGRNWIQLAAIELGKPMTESIWFHKDDFLKFLKECTYSITKQTKSVPVVSLMSKKQHKAYLDEMNCLESDMQNESNLQKKCKLMIQRKTCYVKYLKQDEFTLKLHKKQKSITARTKAEAIPVSLDILDIYDKWQAPHDLKEYGDTDEAIYRNFFSEGYVRIELHFPDENGCIGKKIFYVPDPDYIKDNGQRLIFAEKDWQEYGYHMSQKNDYT